MKITLVLLVILTSMQGLAAADKDLFATATEKAFNGLNKNTIQDLGLYYDTDARFKDPITDIQGLAKIKEYYAHVYKGVTSIHFDFQSITREGPRQTAVWKMLVVHPDINSGKEISLDGVSIVDFNLSHQKVLAHRDYYDVGEFIYERIPILGSIIRLIKDQMRP